LANKFGVTLTFIATRSGLTRFEDHWTKSATDSKSDGSASASRPVDSPDEGQALPEDSYEPIAPISSLAPMPDDPEADDLELPEPEQSGNGAEFAEKHNRASDEPFYKRAVDFHLVDESAFVYSVPFAIGHRAETEAEVTASRAIFVGQGQERAPAAVVGLRMHLRTFADKFFNSSNRCERGQCANLCQRWTDSNTASTGSDQPDIYRCLLIDNNAYVVVDSGSHASIGRSLVELDAPLFNTLVEAGVYRSVRMFDYQSMCIELLEKPLPVGSGGTCRAEHRSIVSHTLQSMVWLLFELSFSWHRALVEGASSVWTQMSSAYQDTSGQEQFAADQSDSAEPPSVRGMAKDSKGKLLPPNRTRPFPCDKQFSLYDLQASSRSELSSRPLRREYVKCDDCQQ
jgi:hypothetical protein